MYIAPNSIIRCLSGVPIDNTYRNTLWWNSAADQEAYFYSKSKVSLGAQSYQRANRGFLKINVAVEQLYDCNYLMFQNTSFGSKWFYAFITSVEYISNDVSRVRYELDVMQTWFFDYTLGTNFVEREHSLTDGVGDNLIEENLETGEIIANGAPYEEGATRGVFDIVIAATFTAELNQSNTEWIINSDPGGAIYNSCYSGLYFIVCSTPTVANLLIKTASEQMLLDGIIAIFMYPHTLLASAGGRAVEIDNIVTIPKPAFDGTYPSIHGYTPRNRKLYTYPFSQLLLTDGGQQTMALRYEDFSGANCNFKLIGETSINPSVAFIAKDYKGLSGANPLNAMIMSGFPMCPWSYDTFKAYIAQTYGPAAAMVTPPHTNENRGVAGTVSTAMPMVNAIGRGAGAIGRAMIRHGEAGIADSRRYGASIFEAENSAYPEMLLGTGLQLGGDFLKSVSESVKGISDAFLENAQLRGTTSDTALVNFGFKGFKVYPMSVKYDYAVTIDNYFTMFGYATKRVKVPNRSSRPHYNYVKLIGTHIEGTIPFDHEGTICKIYDSGITFWKNPTEVGHYELDNRPV